MAILLTKLQYLAGQLFCRKKRRGFKLQETDSRQKSLKMKLFQQQTAFRHFHRFKQAIAIAKPPVIGRNNSCSGRKGLPVKIYESPPPTPPQITHLSPNFRFSTLLLLT